MADLIDIASKEVGYQEQWHNVTKYGNGGLAWCHFFVSWCAKKAKLTDYVPNTGSVDVGINWYKNKKRFKKFGTYIPKRNDIIYMKSEDSPSGHHVGIVEKVKNNRVHTIEGNSSDMVKRRSYALSDSGRIIGYGLVNKYITSSDGSSKSSLATGKVVGGGSSKVVSDTGKIKTTTDASVKKELDYLNKMLKKAKAKGETVEQKSVTITAVKDETNVNLQVTSTHNNVNYNLPIVDGAHITFEIKGQPGTFEFTTIQKNLKIYNGDPVSVLVNNKKFFFGFVFKITPKKNGTVEVLAYDQLRYLKNKNSYFIKKKTATKMLKKVAKDFGLKVGKCADTKIQLTRIDQDKTLFDIIENYLSDTTWRNGKTYILYDDYGKLRLREPWKVNILLDEDTAQDYVFTRTIDDETYNQIKLAFENKKKGTLDTYVLKSSKSQNKWGTLQYYEKIDSPKIAKKKAKLLMIAYNKEVKTLSISDAFGSAEVRAGCLVPVMMNLYENKISTYLVVDKVVHKFVNSRHLMDLELSGGVFNSSY